MGKVSIALVVLLLATASLSSVTSQIEKWVPYVPRESDVELYYCMKYGVSYVNVSIMFPTSGFNVSDWGILVWDENSISVDAEIWRWTGVSFPVVTMKEHAYNLGVLRPGEYNFTFMAWGYPVKSITFRIVEISGLVWDYAGNPLPDVKVEAIGQVLAHIVCINSNITNSNGEYTLIVPVSGYIKLVARSPNPDLLGSPVKYVSPSCNERIDFVLYPLKELQTDKLEYEPGEEITVIFTNLYYSNIVFFSTNYDGTLSLYTDFHHPNEIAFRGGFKGWKLWRQDNLTSNCLIELEYNEAFIVWKINVSEYFWSFPWAMYRINFTYPYFTPPLQWVTYGTCETYFGVYPSDISGYALDKLHMPFPR